MKKNRLSIILDLILKYDIETQEAMQAHLLDLGIHVTQATISRDIKELKLIKVAAANGKSKYAVPPTNQNLDRKFNDFFLQSIVHVDYAINTVVVKCGVGMAQAACASFDNMNFSQVVGTIAGDDTIFILTRSEASALDLYETILQQIKKV